MHACRRTHTSTPRIHPKGVATQRTSTVRGRLNGKGSGAIRAGMRRPPPVDKAGLSEEGLHERTEALGGGTVQYRNMRRTHAEMAWDQERTCRSKPQTGKGGRPSGPGTGGQSGLPGHATPPPFPSILRQPDRTRTIPDPPSPPFRHPRTLGKGVCTGQTNSRATCQASCTTAPAVPGVCARAQWSAQPRIPRPPLKKEATNGSGATQKRCR